MSTVIASYHLTTEDVRARLNFGKVESVLALIHSGELTAVNIGTRGKRPLWRLSEADLAQFIQSRRHTATPKPAPNLRRQPVKATQYF